MPKAPERGGSITAALGGASRPPFKAPTPTAARPGNGSGGTAGARPPVKAGTKSTAPRTPTVAAPPSSLILWNDPPDPTRLPYIEPGRQGVYGLSYAVGTVVQQAPGFDGRRYGFRFHYNPNVVTMRASYDENRGPQPSADGGIKTFVGNSSVGFEIMLNRMEEVAVNRQSGRSVLGRTDFRTLGTMHDIEWLYMISNGTPPQKGKSADVGVLYYRQVILNMGPLRLEGYINNIDVQNEMFSPGMTPILSKVTLGFVRNIAGYLSPDGSSDAAAGDAVGVGGAVTNRVNTAAGTAAKLDRVP